MLRPGREAEYLAQFVNASKRPVAGAIAIQRRREPGGIGRGAEQVSEIIPTGDTPPVLLEHCPIPRPAPASASPSSPAAS